jgi:dienelactone hydrolase
MRAVRRPAIALLATVMSVAAAGAQEATLVPVTVDGERVRLEMRIYRPATAEPAPTLVFNHGSTGRGTDPRAFTRPIDFPEVAKFFVARGWAVVMPARRGRGGSEGVYDEGFGANRAFGYVCDSTLSLAGADHALRDVEAAMDAILAMPFVDTSRVVIGGQSRGGVLSVAYAGRRPEQLKGVINFAGGWLGAGCRSPVNRTLFERGARYSGETLWLYGDEDRFYPLSHSRENFAAFQAAGGKGRFQEFPAAAGGHGLWQFPSYWGPFVESYLKQQGLPSEKRETGVSR